LKSHDDRIDKLEESMIKVTSTLNALEKNQEFFSKNQGIISKNLESTTNILFEIKLGLKDFSNSTELINRELENIKKSIAIKEKAAATEKSKLKWWIVSTVTSFLSFLLIYAFDKIK